MAFVEESGSVKMLVVGLAWVALVLFVPGRAAAQSDALADSLFRQAREAMKGGDYATACPKLRESHRLDPSAGALLNLAVCERHLGRVATAWTRFRELADILPTNDERQAIVRRHITELEPQLPRLHIRAVDVPDAVVRLDGFVLQAPSLQADLPVDPGSHEVELLSSDRVLARETVTIGIAERVEVTLIPTAGEPAAAKAELMATQPARARAVPPPSGSTAPHALREVPPSPRSRFLPAAYVASGVALGGFTLAIVSGSLAIRDKNVVSEHCPNRTCDATGAEATKDGQRHVAMANAGLVLGVAGLAVAGALFWHALN